MNLDAMGDPFSRAGPVGVCPREPMDTAIWNSYPTGSTREQYVIRASHPIWPALAPTRSTTHFESRRAWGHVGVRGEIVQGEA